MLTKVIVTTCLTVVLWSVCVRSDTVHIYVSPTGSDSNDGRTPSHPVKTLHHVVNMLQNDGIKGNTVFVELMQGYHDLTTTLDFRTSLGGTVVFRAYQGQEVHVTGGKRIPSGQFHRVSDPDVQHRLAHGARGKVLELNLTAAGITNLGTLTTYGFFYYWTAPLEVFINGRPLRLAEWPNRKFVNIKSVPDGSNGTRFTFDSDDRDSNWVNETEPWVYGWWVKSWADSSLPVSHIDPNTHTITLGAASKYGLTVGHYKPDTSAPQVDGKQQGGYFRVFNMLSELDQPGEYYVDRTNKMLYIWPNTPNQRLASTDVVYASMLDRCILIHTNAHNLHFEDFSLENCRQYGFFIFSGKQLTFKNMEIKNTGSFGIRCQHDCRNVSVLASEFHDTGGGVYIAGGDLPTLTSSGTVIQDNHLWDFDRMAPTTGEAVHMEGVHATVSYNHIHHGQHNAIRYGGNDHVIEYNNVHHLCRNVTDCGAINSGRDWSRRGNVIRYNHVHDNLHILPGADVRGIMLDDEYSSALIEHNVFYHNHVHINIGGGRDNVIRYSVMYNATSRFMQVDARGLGNTNAHGSELRQKLAASPYQTQLWTDRYPKLANILQGHPEAPEGNQIYNNAIYNAPGVERVHYTSSHIDRADYFDVHDNYWGNKTDFIHPVYGQGSVRCGAADWVTANHFQQPVSLFEIGPRVPTGPHYLRVQRPQPTVNPTSAPQPCPPDTTATASAGSRSVRSADTGCWIRITSCPAHRDLEGFFSDTADNGSGLDQSTCFDRASHYWSRCGSDGNAPITAYFRPTAANHTVP